MQSDCGATVRRATQRPPPGRTEEFERQGHRSGGAGLRRVQLHGEPPVAALVGRDPYATPTSPAPPCHRRVTTVVGHVRQPLRPHSSRGTPIQVQR
eukprot:scaffold1033_cov408-Prasinococcus_capsulatus_cf.AAC.14